MSYILPFLKSAISRIISGVLSECALTPLEATDETTVEISQPISPHQH